MPSAGGGARVRSSDSQFGHNPEPQPGPAPGRAGRVPSPPREAADPAGWTAPRPRTRSPYDPTPVGRCFSTPGRFGERESQPPPHTATSKRYACRAMMLVRTCSRAISHVKALCMRRAGGRRPGGTSVPCRSHQCGPADAAACGRLPIPRALELSTRAPRSRARTDTQVCHRFR